MGVSNQRSTGAATGGTAVTETGGAGSDFQKFVSDLEKILAQHRRQESSKGSTDSPEALLYGMICAMCDFPESVAIDQHVTDHSASFDVHLHPEDVSKVLGTGGSHATALRVLFSAIYSKRRKKLHLMVVNPNYRR